MPRLFQSTGSREAIPSDLLQKRLLLCMYGMGTNMGLKRMAGVDSHITAEDLRYTRRRYLHKEHVRAAIAQVVNALLHARLEAIWGAATSTYDLSSLPKNCAALIYFAATCLLP
jgi:hypothetical protein